MPAVPFLLPTSVLSLHPPFETVFYALQGFSFGFSLLSQLVIMQVSSDVMALIHHLRCCVVPFLASSLLFGEVTQ